MTTIAYRAGVLAADTLETHGDTKLPRVSRKVFKLRDGSLFGGAGVSEDIELVKRSLAKGHKGLATAFKDPLDVSALHIKPDGSIWETEGRVWSRVDAPYVAIGSGGDFALCAFELNQDAKTAVKMGIKFDRNSGGKVQSVKLKEPK